MIPVLLAHGAVLELPLGGTDMHVTVLDAAEAEPWLTRRLGADVALEVLAGRTTVQAPARIGRLALALWAMRWWPASVRLGIPALDGALLALDAAASAAVLDDVLDPFEATAAEWFDVARSDAAGLHLRGPGVEEAALALVEHFDAESDDARRDEAAALARAAAMGADGSLRRRDVALAAGAGRGSGTDAVLANGTASVDWALVPPGVLDAAEHTVRWRLDAVGSGAAVRVEVDALPGAIADGVAAVVVVGTREVRVPLTRSAAVLSGRVAVDDAVAAAMLGSARSGGVVPGAGIPEDAVTVHVAASSVLEDASATTAALPSARDELERTSPDARATVVAWVLARRDAPARSLLLAERGVQPW